MSARRIFPRGGQWGGRKDGSPQRGPGAEPQWGGAGSEVPKSWRHFLKIMHKYFLYWDFRQHLQNSKHCNITSAPLCPWLLSPWAQYRVKLLKFEQHCSSYEQFTYDKLRKSLSESKVKVKFYQNLIISMVHCNTYSNKLTSISDQ